MTSCSAANHSNVDGSKPSGLKEPRSPKASSHGNCAPRKKAWSLTSLAPSRRLPYRREMSFCSSLPGWGLGVRGEGRGRDVLLQQPTDEVGRVGVHAGRVGHGALEDLAVGGEVVLRLEGRVTVEHLVEEHAQRPVVHLVRGRGGVRVRGEGEASGEGEAWGEGEA